MKRLIVCLSLIILSLLLFSSCSSGEINMRDVKAKIDSMNVSDFEDTDKVTEYVKISVADFGDIIVYLSKDDAPKTVKNFQNLVSEGFYDGLTFHRVYPGFMIQGGDPNGNGSGNSDTYIKGEFSANGVTNDLSHIRGVISMARGAWSYDSASCQFFIMHDDAPDSLDGSYAAFGYVVAGLSVVDEICEIDLAFSTTDYANTTPVESVIITSITFVSPK